jgi:hypothetical protein
MKWAAIFLTFFLLMGTMSDVSKLFKSNDDQERRIVLLEQKTKVLETRMNSLETGVRE